MHMTSIHASGLSAMASTESAHDNRRRSAREPYVIQAWVSSPTASPGEAPLEALAVNLSRHGIRFDMKAPLPVGCFYMIEVGLGEHRIHTEIRVVSSHQVDTHRHSIGATFC